MKKNEVINLISNNYKIDLLIDELKEKPSIYNKILNSLLFLGNFDKDIPCYLYKEVDNKYESFTKAWCEDNNSDVFIICLNSKNRSDLNMITKIGSEEINYDISLTKKYELNEDNVDLTRFDNQYNCKFGRLITDNINYFNLFLSDNVCYQFIIKGNENIIKVNTLLEELNKMDNIPTIKVFSELFSKLLNDIKYDELIMKSYKDFEVKMNVSLEGNKKENALKRTKK